MKKILINLILYIFLPSIIPLFITTNTNSNEYTILMFISYILLTIYFIWIYKKDLLKYLKDFNIKTLKKALLIFLIGFGLIILSNYIINYIIIPHGLSNNEIKNRELLKSNIPIYSILLCLIVPFLEEIVFRLEFKKNIKNKYIFLLLTSFIFSSLHILSSTKLIEILYIIPYFIFGYTLGLIYYKTDNILYNVIGHMINNIITLIVVLVF